MRAKALPEITADVPTVMASPAIILPTKFDEYPSVADVPIAQNTLDAWALFTSLMNGDNDGDDNGYDNDDVYG